MLQPAPRQGIALGAWQRQQERGSQGIAQSQGLLVSPSHHWDARQAAVHAAAKVIAVPASAMLAGALQPPVVAKGVTESH